jgi:hypothetical protein
MCEVDCLWPFASPWELSQEVLRCLGALAGRDGLTKTLSSGNDAACRDATQQLYLKILYE